MHLCPMPPTRQRDAEVSSGHVTLCHPVFDLLQAGNNVADKGRYV